MHRTIRKVSILGVALSAVGALWAAPQTGDDKPKLPNIRVSGDWGDGSTDDVHAILQSCAENLLRYCPERRLGTILVRPHEGVPITLFEKGPAGEYQVLLSAHDAYWSQYAYQFSHELVHILSNYDRRKTGRNLWFEESLCETSSLFTMRKMAVSWKTKPPFPNWSGFASHLDQYVDTLLAPRRRRLPPDRTMAQWFHEHEPSLAQQRELTPDSQLVAVYLLSIFEDEPTGWESLTWINLGPHDSEIDLRDYLQGWKERVPERQRAFLGKIQKLFGFE
jgi:hypothetical protein